MTLFTGLMSIFSNYYFMLNIEDTHLTDIERIEKLFALVTVAFT
jgi:hypothetical protein